MHCVAWFCSTFFLALLCFYWNQSQFFHLSFNISTSCPILIRALHVQGENPVHLRVPAAWALLWAAFYPTKVLSHCLVFTYPPSQGPWEAPLWPWPALLLTSALGSSSEWREWQRPSQARASHSPTVPWLSLLCALSPLLLVPFFPLLFCSPALFSCGDSALVSLALCCYESPPLSCPLVPPLALFIQFVFDCCVGIWLPVSICMILCGSKLFPCRLFHSSPECPWLLLNSHVLSCSSLSFPLFFVPVTLKCPWVSLGLSLALCLTDWPFSARGTSLFFLLSLS